MMLISYMTVLLLNLFNMFFNVKIRLVEILSIILLYVLMWGNNYNPDYTSYLMYYEGLAIYNVEPIFKFLVVFFYRLGFTYQHFLLIMGFLSFVLVGNTINRYINNYSIIISLYLMSAFAMDIITIRSTFALSLIIFALPYFAQGKRKSYTICVIIASLIHVSMLIFLVPIIIKPNRLNIIGKPLILSIAIFSILSALFGKSIYSILANLVTALPIRNISAYGLSDKIGNGWLLYLILWLCNIISVYLARKYYYSHPCTANNNEIGKLIEFITITNLFTGIFVPLAAFNSNFYRFVKTMILPNLIMVSAIFYGKKPGKSKRVFSIYFENTRKWKMTMLLYLLLFIPWFVNEVSGIGFSFTLFKQIIMNNIFY